MLSALILENFKAFGRRQVIPLAPITLIFGANSSGKSSILQSLLLLKQTIEQPEGNNALLAFRREPFDFGGFRDLVHGHGPKTAMEIAVLLVPRDPVTRELRDTIGSSPAPIGMGLRASLDETERGPKLDELSCYLGNTDRPAYRLTQVEGLLDHENVGGPIEPAPLARVSAVDPAHPLWLKLFDEFTEYLGPKGVSGLLTFIGMPRKELESDLLDADSVRFAGRALRAINGDLREQEFHMDVFRRSLLLSLSGQPENIDSVLKRWRIPEAKTGCGDSEAEVRLFFYNMVRLFVGWGEYEAWDEENVGVVADMLGDSEVYNQITRLVDTLRLLDMLLDPSYDQQELAEELDAFGIPSDKLLPLLRQQRPRLERIRGMLQSRLRSLADYSIGRYCEDARAEGGLTTVILRGFLPHAAPFPALVSEDLAEVLGAWLGGWTRGRWSMLPDLARATLVVAESIRREFGEVAYLGPIREHPKRDYHFGGGIPRHVGDKGRLLPDILYSQPQRIDETNSTLREWDVGYTLKVDPIRGNSFEVQLVDASGTAINMPDVGFGISQVLPIIVESKSTREGIILIEQPELHLHPRLQAKLGSLFAECVGEPYGNQFIIETHSEHLILRIQRLIRQGKLKNSDVSVVYVMKGEEGSVCYPLRLDQEGDFIDEWPEGFFEEGYREIFS